MVMMHKALRFDSFTLDLERLRLDSPAGHAGLRRKSFDVLRYLIEHAGSVVTKEELIKDVWPDVTVSDESLTQCISEVRRALGKAGHRIVKTVPRRGYLFDAPIDPIGADALVETLASPLPLPDRPSIAVLPFANMSGDPEREYIADGIVEDITTELSRFRELFVIARNSSFRYKGQAVDVRQVGRELGVRDLLPDVSSFIRRVCSGYAPMWGVLRTQSV
jgi:adenylate cyclase